MVAVGLAFMVPNEFAKDGTAFCVWSHELAIVVAVSAISDNGQGDMANRRLESHQNCILWSLVNWSCNALMRLALRISA